ncbi:Uncharacterised protein [Mycobacteroides abscessus subsp. abscessus]|nr:Uncharacterised protein [Mycobacteroides abscessus subsp. abscessus]
MLLCYIDESGDEQALRTNTDPPVLVLAEVVVDHTKVREYRPAARPINRNAKNAPAPEFAGTGTRSGVYDLSPTLQRIRSRVPPCTA